MTKYYEPKPAVYCLTCDQAVEKLTDWARLHKTHYFVKAAQFGRFGGPNKEGTDSVAYDGSEPFADLLDPDVQGEKETLKRLAKGEKAATVNEEENAARRALGIT